MLLSQTEKRELKQRLPLIIGIDQDALEDLGWLGLAETSFTDVTHAYLRLAERLDDPQVQGQAFNFSPERALTVLEIIEVIQRLMGCQHLAPDVRNTAQGEIFSQYLSAEKAQRMLGWRPRYSLDEGLAETIGWYREFLAG